MARRKGAVRRVGFTVPYVPVGDEPGDGALSSLGLVVNVPITVPFERNSAERTDEEEGDQVGEVELLTPFIRREDFIEVHSIRDEIIAPERKVPSRLLIRMRRPFSFTFREAESSPFPPITFLMPKDSSSFSKSSFDTFKLTSYMASASDSSAVDISFALPPEDVHGEGLEGVYSLVRLHGSLQVLYPEVFSQHLLAVRLPVNETFLIISPEISAIERFFMARSIPFNSVFSPVFLSR